MNKVIIISPFSGKTEKEKKLNKIYTRLCLAHSLKCGESPIAFHLLYPQVLNDNNPEERKKGMQAAYEWYSSADYVIVYTDYGISKGMEEDIKKIIEISEKIHEKIIKRKLYA